MLQLQGLAVWPGVAIRKVLILDQIGFRISSSQIQSSDRHNKTQRLPKAVVDTAIGLGLASQKWPHLPAKQFGDIGCFHQRLPQPLIPPRWIVEV
ncbi:MAG TPA: hypothetical protein DCF63_03475 [Planctomycetaceae bacterium]|nr:hypothetical protein [Planctomycetaceae bacterium]